MLMTARLSRPSRLRFALAFFCFAVWAGTAHARIFPIPAGASSNTVQHTIDLAGASLGGNTVSFTAGNYSLGSLLIRCPASPLVITGPQTGYPNAWNDRPKAVITSISGGGHTFNIAAPCKMKISIMYLEVHGNRPTKGGGAIYVAKEGVSNLTVSYNYFHGNQLPYPVLSQDGSYYDA